MDKHKFDKKIYITFDIDWLCDEGLDYTVDFLEKLDIKATFFVTHDTYLLKFLRELRHELGIHPNFNQFFEKDTHNKIYTNISEIVAGLMEIVPEAVTVRSHSLTKNSKLSFLFHELGFTYEANLFIPIQSGIHLLPFYDSNGLIHLAHNWGDYSHWSAKSKISPDGYLDISGLKILNFHPIHIFLNTNDLSIYNQAKQYTKQYTKLRSYINRGQLGTRDFLTSLVYEAKIRNFEFETLNTILI